MRFFEKYLTVFVILAMIVGVFIGETFSAVPEFLNRLTIARISLPIGVLIWFMIYPSMLKVDFNALGKIKENPKGLYLTWIVNWIIKPMSMFLIAGVFFLVLFTAFIERDIAVRYLAGAVILGAAPCTAMVFVWSNLSKGNPAYTLVQVATNNIILLVLFVPIVKLLLSLIPNVEGNSVFIPWSTLFLSVVLFVVVPLVAASLTRHFVIKKKSVEYLNERVIPKFSKVTMTGLMLTLVLIFTLQSDIIMNNPGHILLISIPLVIQTFFIFTITYLTAKKMKLPHTISAPAGFIGASNFFELAVAVAITIGPVVALATVVGLLVEVPVMLALVAIANRTKKYFVKARR